MLTINPSKRIAAAEALKHPWISVSLPPGALSGSASRRQGPDPRGVLALPPALQAQHRVEAASARDAALPWFSRGSGDGRCSVLASRQGVPLA